MDNEYDLHLQGPGTKFRNNKGDIEEQHTIKEPNNTKEYKTNWSAKRRENWNTYMRNYNAKKKQQYKERLNKITIEYHNTFKTYDKEDLTEILYNDINIYGTILNSYLDVLPEGTANKICETYNKNNIVESLNILQKYIKTLLQM